MFENDLVDLDADGTLCAAEANEHALIEGEVRRLLLAAHWADLHPGDAVDPDGLPGGERAVRPGGDGTPEIAGFAAAELGCSLRLSAGSAERLIADALDLVHRLPRTWAAARAGQGPVYQARQIARETRHLTLGQAALVDAGVAAAVGRVSWGRLRSLLDGLIYRADPEAAEAAAEQAARDRFVRLGRGSEHGLKLVIARAAAGDALWFKATIDRIAQILGRDGDPDPIQLRRAKAIGILAQPAEALRLLCTHHDDPDGAGPDDGDHPDEVEPDRPNAAVALAPATASGVGVRSLEIGPPPFDPERARPKAVVYVHLSGEALRAGGGVARVEDIGPVLATRLRQLLGDRCRISLRPVIDLNEEPAPVDSYEIPTRIAEQVRLRQPVDVFPYAAGGSRRTDLDHTIPYRPPDRGGPPGQTGVGNLGPLVRTHHRLKTHTAWQLRQPEPGSWIWRTPTGRIYLVNPGGTHTLGKAEFAQRIWRAAKGPPQTEPAEPIERGPLEMLLRADLDAFMLIS